MKLRVLFIIAWLLSGTLWGLAQTASGTADAKSRIREIKLSENYFYADAMSSESTEEAMMMAAEELRITVVGELTTIGLTKDEIEDRLLKIDAQIHSLQYTQMGMFKAFAYLPKTWLKGDAPAEDLTAEAPVTETPVVTPVIETPVEKPVAETPVVTPVGETPVETPVVETPVVETPADSVVADIPSLADNTPDEADFAIPDTTAVTPDEPEAATETPAVPAVAAEERTDSVAAPAPQPQTPLTADLDSLPGPQERVVADLLALDTYEGVMLYLDGMKEDGRLMYGRISTLVKPEEAYFIIVKNGKLLTVLDRGSGERTNLRTRQPDRLNNYKGHAVIWLKVFDYKQE